jgi:hypothetical protein
MAIGVVGVWLVLLDLARERRLYALGCVLVALSVLYRPPLYFVAVPALGLASLRLGRRFWRADVLLGWCAILAALAFWLLYPRAIEAQTLEAPIGLGFMVIQWRYVSSSELLPAGWIAALGMSGTKAVIVALAYAALALPGLALARELARGAEPRRRVLAAATRPEVLAVLLIFAWGTLSGMCFFQRDEDYLALNYAFGAAAAYVCFLPLLCALIARIEHPVLRACAWSVYAAHLASGALNLWIYFDTALLI